MLPLASCALLSTAVNIKVAAVTNCKIFFILVGVGLIIIEFFSAF
jgi:hypothetical protein